MRVNPVPRGLPARRQDGSRRSRTEPLVGVPRTLPRILASEEADRLVAAPRTHRDRAIVLVMNPVSARTNQIKANYYSSKQPFTGGQTVRDYTQQVPDRTRLWRRTGLCPAERPFPRDR